MNDVTHILSQVAGGDVSAAERLLPLVYDELRRLAAHKMRHESPDHSLQATELVHEAYLRLVGGEASAQWNSSGHFFAAAAQAMRRILIENARRRQAVRHGGKMRRRQLELNEPACPAPDTDVLALDEALNRLAEIDPLKARLVDLRFFAGLTIQRAADCLGISTTTAERYWNYSRAWLHQEILRGDQ